MPCYLETGTDLNLEIHGKQGYRLLGSHDLPVGKSKLHCMVRQPPQA